jgi:hypothetical protein
MIAGLGRFHETASSLLSHAGMTPRAILSKSLATGTLVAALAAISSSAPAEAETECTVSDVDYAVAGDLLVKDTQFGAGNGLYHMGEGRLRLRFESKDGSQPTTARLMSYDLDNHFTVDASFAAWSTHVVTQTHTSVASAGECEGAAVGQFDGGKVVWQTPVDGYHSDGSLACSGNVCGKFGAPPAGASPYHEASNVKFSPFQFSPDGKTFTMNFTRVSHSDSPRQTGYLALSGREMKRMCVHTTSCQ